MLKKYSQKGFTIVELLIVIVVIGILAALVLNTFSGVQKRARDTQRQTDINAIATQLEVYYNDKGGYPEEAVIDAPELKGIDVGALTPPGRDNRSIIETTEATALADLSGGTLTANSQYGYQTLEADGTTACVATAASDVFCPKFKLFWIKEDVENVADGVQVKSSLN